MTPAEEVNSKAADLLEAAGCVIRLPGWWTQEAYARDKDGKSVLPQHESATSFCLIGAYQAAGGKDKLWNTIARDAVNAVLPFRGISQFNDAKGRTAEEVSDAMLLAAFDLRKGVASHV